MLYIITEFYILLHIEYEYVYFNYDLLINFQNV